MKPTFFSSEVDGVVSVPSPTQFPLSPKAITGVGEDYNYEL